MMIGTKQSMIIFSLWLVALGAQAQETGWVLNDVAYALENPTNREEVALAMQQFQQNTQVALSVSAEFEQGTYATDARQQTAVWLQAQTHGITVFITLAKDTKAFRECKIEVSEAVASLLPAEDQEQIRVGLMEFYFRSSPIPTDAYTRGLLAGIKAMAKGILEGRADEKDKLPSDVVTITHLDQEFAAGIDDDKLKIEYVIKEEYVGTLQAAKLEVYKDLAKEPCFTTALDIKEANTFLWDGKLSEKKDDYITYKDSPFTVKITVSEDEKFEKMGVDERKASVEEFADEWRSYPEMAKFVEVNRKDKITGNKLTKYQYYLTMRPQMYDKLSFRKDALFMEEYNDSPIKYLSENIEDAEFLGRKIKVHKNYLSVLKVIESEMGKPSGDYEKYSKDEKYSMGGFNIRYLNYRDEMSNHSFGMAIDVDAKYNPQKFAPTWTVVYMVTNHKLLSAKLKPEKMRTVNNLYKSAKIDQEQINNIKTGLEEIDVHNNTYDYDIVNLQDLDQVVSKSFSECRRLYDEIRQHNLRLLVLADSEDDNEKKMINQRLKTKIPDELDQQKETLSSTKNNVISLGSMLNDGYESAFKMKERYPS